MPTEAEVQELTDRQAAGETLTADELAILNAGATPEPGQELTPEQLKAELAKAQKRIADLNRESAERRNRLKEVEKAEQDRKNAELPELERTKAERAQAQKELDGLKTANKALLLQTQFERTVRTLKLEFANEKAQEDAFRLLENEEVGEDGSGMRNAIVAMQKDRPYLFGKATIPPDIDAQKKGRTNGDQVSESALAAKRADYGAL